MAKVSGSLRWAQELRSRIDAHMDSYRRIEHPCMEGKAAKDVFEHHEKLTTMLAE